LSDLGKDRSRILYPLKGRWFQSVMQVVIHRP
jgi:hypothetical protein